MGLIVTVERGEGRQGMSLAALAVSAQQAVTRAIEEGADPDQIEPHVRVTPRGLIKRMEVKIP